MVKLDIKDKRKNKFLSRKFLVCSGYIAACVWLKHCGQLNDFFFSIDSGLALLLCCIGTVTDTWISKLKIGADGVEVNMDEDKDKTGKVVTLNEDKKE